MRSFLFIPLLLLSSCIEDSFEKRIQKGPVRWDEVTQKKGPPLLTYPTPIKDRIHEYEGESFQVNGDKVRYYQRRAQGAEQNLPYWIHRWKDDVYHFTTVEQKTQGHTPPDLYYINYSNNERFVYKPISSKVTKVIFKLTTDTEPL